MKKKIHTLKDAFSSLKGIKSVTLIIPQERRRDTALLSRCYQAWANLDDVRKTRERVLNYCYGDQWGDIIEYKNGQYTEREFLKMQGNIPLTNNIMISNLNTLVGLYAKQGSEPLCFARTHDAQWLSDMMSATMQANWQDTHMHDLLKHAFEEYLIGGVAIARETYEEREQLFDSYTDIYNPSYVFWEGGNDVRHTDMDLIGVLHDISPEELFFRFTKPQYGFTVDELKRLFDIDNTDEWRETSGIQQNDLNRLANINFYSSADYGKVRIIEVWYRKNKERYQCYDPIATSSDDAYFRCELEDIAGVIAKNEERRALYDQENIPQEQRAYISFERIVDVFWQFCYLAPDGTVLCEGETPYEFKSHPFTLSTFPFINGEIHPYMGNQIDQNRFINRLIVMHDMAVRSSAKGITLVPSENIPDGMDPRDFAEEFTSYDGLLIYDTNKINPNLRPEVITSNATSIGTTELLQMEINLIERVSNVSGALQGKTPTAGTSASRYAMETQNATTSLYTLLQDFTSFSESIGRKKCYMIKQFYPDGRIITNLNKDGVIEYDRMSARDVAFKVSIKESAASAAHQMQANDIAMQLLQLGAISPRSYLRNVNLPFAEKMLRDMDDEQAQQQHIAELQQQIAQQGGANQQQVAQAEQLLGAQPQQQIQEGGEYA